MAIPFSVEEEIFILGFMTLEQRNMVVQAKSGSPLQIYCIDAGVVFVIMGDCRLSVMFKCCYCVAVTFKA